MGGIGGKVEGLEGPALVVERAEHVGPASHEDDEEGKKHEAGDQLSLSSAALGAAAGARAVGVGGRGRALGGAHAARCVVGV